MLATDISTRLNPPAAPAVSVKLVLEELDNHALLWSSSPRRAGGTGRPSPRNSRASGRATGLTEPIHVRAHPGTDTSGGCSTASRSPFGLARILQSRNLLARPEEDSPKPKLCLREALRLNPDDADVLNNLGTAVWEQGRAPKRWRITFAPTSSSPTTSES